MKLKILSIDSLPNWCKDNRLITSGYREPKNSFIYCLKSILNIHNESANILTHFMGSKISMK